MLTVEPTGVLNPQLTPADYTVDWFMSTDNGASYSLIAQAAGNTIAVRPLNNQYRYYAVIKPSDGGNYYRSDKRHLRHADHLWQCVEQYVRQYDDRDPCRLKIPRWRSTSRCGIR